MTSSGLDVQVACCWTDPAHADLALPKYMTAGSSGMDVAAAVSEPLVLEPMARVLVPTGLSFEIPVGYEVQVRPRSGLAWRHGVTVLNAPGTIDADYRGEVKVLLVNLSNETHTIHRGDRIAQLVVAQVTMAQMTLKQSLAETQRGSGGFGHTGR